MNATAAPLFEARGVWKRYGAHTALRDASIALHGGEVVGLVGDNGAGKSTLTGIMSGAIEPSEGELLIDGQPQQFKSPLDVRRHGIETVFQDLALAPHLSVADNMFLGREQLSRRGRLFGWLDRGDMQRRSREELDRLQVRIGSVKTPCGALSGGQRQAIAIARAIVWSRRVLLLDEPTAALGVAQQEQVGRMIREAADRGVAVMLISHNMQHVVELCDRVVVLFQGHPIADLRRGEFGVSDLVAWITGAALEAQQQEEVPR